MLMFYRGQLLMFTVVEHNTAAQIVQPVNHTVTIIICSISMLSHGPFKYKEN